MKKKPETNTEAQADVNGRPPGWDPRLNPPGSRWQHESKLGTYDCAIDEGEVITLTHRASGAVQIVVGYEGLRGVDVEPSVN